MRAIVDSVARVVAGSVVASTLTIGDAVIVVENASDFPEPDEGETLSVSVGGMVMAYTEKLLAEDYTSGVTVDTLVLAASATVGGSVNDRVDLSPETVTYEAQVLVAGASTLEAATIVRPGLVNDAALQVSSGGIGTEVLLEDDGDGWEVVKIIGRDPSVHGKFITPATVGDPQLNQPGLASAGTIQTILAESDTATMPVAGVRVFNGSNATGFLVREDGSGSWPGLETVPPVIAAYVGSLPPAGIDGGTL